MLQFDHTNDSSTTDKPSTSMGKSLAQKANSKSSGRWTKEEHQRFVEALKLYGKNWKYVEDHVGTRSGAQIRSHAQKFFNRLEREFNMKFEDLNLQSDKEKFEATLKKIADSHGGSTSADQESSIKEIKPVEKLQKEREQTVETPCKFDTLVQNSMRSNILSVANSPKLDHFEYTPALVRRASRKMSEDILIQTKPYSFFDVLMAKIKANNFMNTPKLSDMVDISSTRSSFDETHIPTQSFQPVSKKEQFLNVSFKPNPRKMSEDNVLFSSGFSQFRKSPIEQDLHKYETITKKLKPN